jgi:hypothetical protein
VKVPRINIIVTTLFLLLVMVLGVYFLGRKSGKKYVPDEVELPPDTQPGGATNFNPGPVTDAIYRDIYSWGLRSTQPYRDALNLSNSQLVAVYNDWNKRYFQKDKETLPQAIAGERTLWNYDWTITAGALLSRFKSLNLV